MHILSELDVVESAYMGIELSRLAECQSHWQFCGTTKGLSHTRMSTPSTGTKQSYNKTGDCFTLVLNGKNNSIVCSHVKHTENFVIKYAKW